MPTQSRGFFSCDYCGLACDTLEEATEHESSHYSKPPSASQTPGGLDTTATPGEPSQHRYPPQAGIHPPYATMGPLPIEHDVESYPPHLRHQMPPYDPSVPPPSATKGVTRSIALLGAHERTLLSIEDSIACQNIELFEATTDELAEHSNSEGNPVVAKQVGIRCVHCAKMPPTAAQSTIFPESLGTIATSVRKVADNHLIACQRVPPEVREACDRAASKRVREQGEQGSATNEDDENDRDQMALIGYCVDFCHRLGVFNKQPHKTGVEFSDGPDAPPHYPPMQTPVAPRGMPAHVFSADRMGPPMSMDRMPFPTPGPPGSIPRGAPPPMMGGPVGPDGIAPTPLQSRRDREGGAERPTAFSADREGGAPPPGYPAGSFPQGPPPGGPEIQTPAQPNYDGQEGAPYPSSAQRSEASPPSGYQESSPQYDLPAHFPFYQETDRSWHCKFCSHVHPQYRDPQSIWSVASGAPPPGPFIDEHLGLCRAYHQSMPSPAMYQGPPGPYGGAPMLGPPMGIYGAPPGPWDGYQYGQPPFPYPPHPDARYPGPEEGFPDQRRLGAPMAQDLVGARGPQGVPGARMSGAAQRKPASSPETIRLCINHLVESESEYYKRNPNNAKIPKLVLDEDRLLLTDYFFYLMKQLQLCRFSESDRKTRGGKREKIKLGYGGLQCVHCSEVPNSRKFFWSNVDRLANSFAEIPGHVLKCRRCPQQTKDALMSLKAYHPEQMARLPRGSQKVFFRRMWRRLHDEDPDPTALATAPSNEENITPEKADPDSPEEKATLKNERDTPESPATVGSPKSEDGSVVKRLAAESAKALAESTTQSGLLSPASRVLLAIPEDKEWLSDMDCFIRGQLEVFCASEEDVSVAQSDRKYPVHVGQVGIRCIHCSLAKDGQGAQGQAVAYPFAISGIYESVREFQRLHLDSCENIPAETKRKVLGFQGSSSLSSVLRKYYVLGAKALGLHDTREGIQAGGEHIPVNPQAAFSFPEGSHPSADLNGSYANDVASSLPAVPHSEVIAGDTEKKASPLSTPEGPASSAPETSKNTDEASDPGKKREAPSSEESDERPAKMAKTEISAQEDKNDAPLESTKEEQG